MVKTEILLFVLCTLSPASACFQLITPSKWGAKPANCSAPLQTTLPEYAVIIHTSGKPCKSRAECGRETRNIQHYHQRTKGWCDIGYSFLIGEDGYVYEGRGWRSEGAHTYGYNDLSLGFAFIGTFTDCVLCVGYSITSPETCQKREALKIIHVGCVGGGDKNTSMECRLCQECGLGKFWWKQTSWAHPEERPPNEAAWKALKCLLDFGVKIGYLASDYLIVAHSDISDLTSPGDPVLREIATWPNYKHN